jgi:hypothetical protein
VPCAADDYDWSVIAKQSNDFSGLPGNDFGPLVDSSLTTSVTGGCGLALRFAAQPANARVNETITTTAYNSPPGDPVSVEVIDGAGNRVTTSNALITLTLASGGGTGTLSGATEVTAVDGLATFDDLSIDAKGTYALLASSAGLVSATSSTFQVDDAATPCAEGETCTATLSNANTRLGVNASPNLSTDAGVLVINRNLGAPIEPQIDCDGYNELSDGDFAVDFRTSGDGREKVATATIDKRTMNAQPENGAAFLNMCFGAPPEAPFAVKPGTPAPQPQQGLLVGLLPDCGAFPPPCVSKRNKTGAGQGVIEVRAPAGPLDPRYSP